MWEKVSITGEILRGRHNGLLHSPCDDTCEMSKYKLDGLESESGENFSGNMRISSHVCQGSSSEDE